MTFRHMQVPSALIAGDDGRASDFSGGEPAGRPIPRDRGALLFPVEAADVLGVSVRTLESWRVRAEGPKYVRLSRHAVRYRRGDLDDWIGTKIVQSTADVRAA